MRIRILSLIIYFCLVFFTANAQEAATVKSFTLTTDHISARDRRNDLNGDACALVKVQVVDDIERVEGNKVGDIVNRGVEKWVYMCKGSRNMRIHLKNHLPVRVLFKDFQISGLESNRVYELVIEIPDAPVTISPNSGSTTVAKQKLILNYSPSNAIVFVDGKQYRGNGGVELELQVGTHDYFIAADGYIADNGEVNLNERAPKEITVKLYPDNDYTQSGQVAENANNSTNNRLRNYLNSTKERAKNLFKMHSGTNSSSEEESDYDVDMDSENHLNSAKERSNNLFKMHSGTNSPSGTESDYDADMDSESGITLSSLFQSSRIFTYNYKNVTFRCKEKKGYVTIIGFDPDAIDVTIPSIIEYDDYEYPVREISTYVKGYSYDVAKLIIEDGIEKIDDNSFREFNNLLEVTIPSSVTEIGKNVFRYNGARTFHLPKYIYEEDLQQGKSIKLR